jgi:hypothetical protein
MTLARIGELIQSRGGLWLAQQKGPAVRTPGLVGILLKSTCRRLLSKRVVETVTGWFKIDVLAELAGFSSAMLAVHADVFPLDR